MQPLLEVTPAFIPKQTMLEVCVTAVFSFLMLGLYPLILPFVNGKEGAMQFGIPLMVTLSLLLTFIPAIGHYYWKKLTYKQTHYQFFADRLIYQESFLNTEEKEISYDRIMETALRSNIIQRMFNVGTVSLLTNATSGTQNSGLKAKDLDDPKEIYTKIKSVLDSHKQSKAA